MKSSRIQQRVARTRAQRITTNVVVCRRILWVYGILADFPCSLMRRDTQSIYSTRPVCTSGAQAYLEDAFGPRVWVEQDACRVFVANVRTAFPEEIKKSNDDKGAAPAPAAATAHPAPMDVAMEGGHGSGASLDNFEVSFSKMT